MGSLCTCTRIALATFNIILLVAFLAIGVTGILMKCSPNSVLKFFTHCSPGHAQEFSYVIRFLLGSVSTYMIAISFIIVAVTMFSVFTLFSDSIWFTGLCVALKFAFIIIQCVVLIYFFAVPWHLESFTTNLMITSLKYIGTHEDFSRASVMTWSTIGYLGEKRCCAYNGVSDFAHLPDDASLPTVCCGHSTPGMNPKCTVDEARKIMPAMEGCQCMILAYVASKKPALVLLLVTLILFQIISMVAFVVLGVQNRRAVITTERTTKITY